MGTKMDASTVYALFEELKLKIEQLSISNESANQIVTNADAKEIIQSVQELQNRIIHEGFSSQQIKELRSNLVQASAYTNRKVNDMLSVVTKELKTAIHSITNKEIQEEAHGKIVNQKGHVFTVDFRNRKAIITMLVMVALILLSGTGNIRQYQVSQRLKENDLKYRYIRMKGEANAEDIIWLETIFKHDRNRDSIAVVRGQVERHEEAKNKLNQNRK